MSTIDNILGYNIKYYFIRQNCFNLNEKRFQVKCSFKCKCLHLLIKSIYLNMMYVFLLSTIKLILYLWTIYSVDSDDSVLESELSWSSSSLKPLYTPLTDGNLHRMELYTHEGSGSLFWVPLYCQIKR